MPAFGENMKLTLINYIVLDTADRNCPNQAPEWRAQGHTSGSVSARAHIPNFHF